MIRYILFLFTVSFAILFGAVAAEGQLAWEMPNQIEHYREAPSFSGVTHLKCLSSDKILVFWTYSGGMIVASDLSTIASFPQARGPGALQADGKLLCRGNTNHCIVRFNADGSIDSTFNSPSVAKEDLDLLRDITLQTDGKLIVCCTTPRLSGSSPFSGINNGLFRLNTDGTPDDGFTPGTSGRSTARAFPLPDGKLLTMPINRLLTNGFVDQTFNKPIIQVIDMALQPDGHFIILAGGGNLRRYEATGSFDPSFSPTNFPSSVASAVRVQRDGGVYVLDGNNIRRWFSDGRYDRSSTISVNSFSGMDVDPTDRIYAFSDAVTVVSARHRIVGPAPSVPVVFETSSLIDGIGATALQVPANTPIDYIVEDHPGAGSAYFRVRPAQ